MPPPILEYRKVSVSNAKQSGHKYTQAKGTESSPSLVDL